MLVALDGHTILLLTQQVKKLALPHYQLDVNKLLINLPMPQIIPCHALTSCFALTKIQLQINVLIFDKCHHNTILSKVSIRVPLRPIYIRKFRKYNKAVGEYIKYGISNFK